MIDNLKSGYYWVKIGEELKIAERVVDGESVKWYLTGLKDTFHEHDITKIICEVPTEQSLNEHFSKNYDKIITNTADSFINEKSNYNINRLKLSTFQLNEIVYLMKIRFRKAIRNNFLEKFGK